MAINYRRLSVRCIDFSGYMAVYNVCCEMNSSEIMYQNKWIFSLKLKKNILFL